MDWDRWIDEDDCEDTECDAHQEEPQVSAFPPTEMAQEEESPMDGDCSERFTRLNPNEKMLALVHAWYAHCTAAR